jgi:hypothetical protein
MRLVEGIRTLPHEIEIFIYTNKDFVMPLNAKNVRYRFFPYKKWGLLGYNRGLWNKLRLTRFVHPYFLTWENRRTIEKSIDIYDTQIYIEDDIAFDHNAFNYWKEYKDICIRSGHNLGFLRVEYDSAKQGYLTDLKSWPVKTIEIEGQLFLVNDVDPYCAFWIYDQNELRSFVNSNEWEFEFEGYGIREKSAIGWHGTTMSRYKNTILPLFKDANGEHKLSDSCIVHHLPNNYVNSPRHLLLRFPKTHYASPAPSTLTLAYSRSHES